VNGRALLLTGTKDITKRVLAHHSHAQRAKFARLCLMPGGLFLYRSLST
jgi:hypothetical protein